MSALIPSTRETLTIGGRVFVDLVNLKILGTRADGGQYGTFRAMNGTSGYQVGASTTLTIHAVRMQPRDGGQTTHGVVFYADNDVGLNSASAPTVSVYPCGDSSFVYLKSVLGTAGGAAGTLDESQAMNFNFQVPSNKYPQFTCTGSSSLVIAYGYER